MTLASDQGGALGLAVDAEAVYWTGPTSVMKTSKMGGPPTTVAGGQLGGPCALTLDGRNVYWINYGRDQNDSGGLHGAIMQAPETGGSAIQLAADQPRAYTGIAVDATSVYWTANPSLDYPSGSVMKVAIGGGTPIALATNQYDPTGIAVDSTIAYWTTENYTLMKVAIEGGTPVRVGAMGPAPLVLRNGFVYSFSGENVVKVPAEGGDTTTLAGSPGHTYPTGIAVDDTSVYWTEDDSVLKISLDGDPQTQMAWRQQTPWAIAVDDTSIYWTDEAAGTVMKLTPK